MGYGFRLNCKSLEQEVVLKYFGRSFGWIALDSKKWLTLCPHFYPIT